MSAWKWAERRQMVKSIREIPANGCLSPPVWDIKIHRREPRLAKAPVAYGPVNIDWYFNYPPHNLIINHKHYSFTFRRSKTTLRMAPMRDGMVSSGSRSPLTTQLKSSGPSARAGATRQCKHALWMKPRISSRAAKGAPFMELHHYAYDYIIITV